MSALTEQVCVGMGSRSFLARVPSPITAPRSVRPQTMTPTTKAKRVRPEVRVQDARN